MSIFCLTVSNYVYPQQVVNFISFPVAVSNGVTIQVVCVSGSGLVGAQSLLTTCVAKVCGGLQMAHASCNPGYTSGGQTFQCKLIFCQLRLMVLQCVVLSQPGLRVPTRVHREAVYAFHVPPTVTAE